MDNALLQQKLASFVYNGVERPLVPGKMAKVRETACGGGFVGVYEQAFEKNLKAALEIESKEEGLYVWVVRFQNTCGEDSKNRGCGGEAGCGEVGGGEAGCGEAGGGERSYDEGVSDGNTWQITRPLGTDLELDCGGAERVVWRSLKGDSCDAESFMPLEMGVEPGGRHSFQPSNGRSSQVSAFPYFDVEYGGRGLVCGIGWSGQWEAELARDGGKLSIKIGQQGCDFFLKPGETARTSSVIVQFGKTSAGNGSGGCCGGSSGDKSDNIFGSAGMQALRNAFRRGHRAHYTPASYLGGDVKVPVSLQDFDRYFWKDIPWFASDETQLKLADAAAKLGADTFWIDAAWFKEGFPNGVGNYTFAPGFPDEFSPVSERVHKYGMRFMVWFEPERVYETSETYAKFAGCGRWLLKINDESPQTRLLNLGDKGAAEWLFGVLSGIVGRNKIDVYRQDFNMDPLGYWRLNDGENRAGLTENKYVEGLYWLWDSLIEKFPGLLIDNCSSGGRRIDFETCRRSVPMWRSDTACSPDCAERPVAKWHQNQTLGLSNYLPYHTASSWFEDAYRFRSGATMGIACAFDVLDPGYDYEAGRAAIAEMEILRRGWAGDFYPLTCQADSDGAWSAYQLNNGTGGFVMAFRREGSGDGAMRFNLKGVDEEKEYGVSFIDERRAVTERRMKGSELAGGFEIELPDRRSSVLITYGQIG